MKLFARISSLICLIVLLSSCTALPEPSPAPQATSSSLPSLTITPTVATLTPTRTPRPTSTKDLRTKTPTLDPAVLTNGIRMVFIEEDQIWIWKNGVRQSITQAEGAHNIWISDDSEVFVYNGTMDERGWFNLLATDINGNTKILVTAEELANMTTPGLGWEWPAMELEWIPQTHELLLNDYEQGQLYILDADEGRWRKLSQLPEPGWMHISPDGKQILIIAINKIYVHDRENSTTRQVLPFPEFPTYSEQPYPHLSTAWAEDGSSFRIEIHLTDDLDPNPKTEIWQVDWPSAEVSLLTTIDTAGLDLSPDGNWAVYGTASPGTNNPQELHLVNLSNGKDFKLYSGGFSLRGWSPDSRRLVIDVSEKSIHKQLLVTVGPEPAIEDLPIFESYNQFMQWIDSQRYLTERGDIRLIGQSISIGTIEDFRADRMRIIALQAE